MENENIGENYLILWFLSIRVLLSNKDVYKSRILQINE